MKINCSYTELVDAIRLKPNPKNPNKHPKEQIDRLAELIAYQGQRSPIVVSRRSGCVVVGHGRLKAMMQLGWEKVAVDYQEFQTDAQEYAHLTADNAINEWSSLDLAEINLNVIDFGPELNVDMLGLKNFTVDITEKIDLTFDDDEEEKPEKIIKCPSCGHEFEEE